MKMKREYSTWYMSGSDTKIKKKKKYNYLFNDKIPLYTVQKSLKISYKKAESKLQTQG